MSSHSSSPIDKGDMLTESRSPGSALSPRSACASASRSMARPSGPASTAGRNPPADRISPLGVRIRASISKKAGRRGSFACTTGW